MSAMKRLSILMGAVVLALVSADVASAQIIPPGGSQFNPPPPAPLPPPQVGAYVTPMVDAPPARQKDQRPPRPSFSDRITTCLHEGAAAGLGPSARADYSRSCANQ